MTNSEPDPGPRTATSLPPQYNPAAVEAELYDRWVERGYFEADAKSDKPPYCVVIPPPNVTGSLHLGHAFEHTLIDTLVRRRRMQGYNALWLPGMDHASIAVEALLKKALAAEGTSRDELGREAFIERTWSWKAEHGGAISGQMRRLGDSVDWSRERFTMDDGLNRAVRTIFKKLYDDGLIYRAERLVNWSPVLRSGISDNEVEHRDVEGELVSLRYGEGDDSLVVATTRVETMLGDTAVAVHPDDERYRHLVGREIELPIVGRRIPVIADEHVDPEFGTGAVKVTPAHDPNDFAMGQRHGLAMPSIFDEEARVIGTGTRFDGMDRFEARVAVREELRAQGRVVAEKRPYVHSVGHSERGKEPVEPRLSMQWFVKVAPLAKSAGDAVRSGEVAIHPPEMAGRYFQWVDDMHDWCISRQLWWGHRIPVWYGPNGEQVCLGPDEEPPGTEADGWRQDPDVLDTWFSSALWPFSTLGWPDDTDDLRTFYPNSVLVTGYDILFFWVIKMMMFGTYAMEKPPYPVIALHGMVRDEHGKKMSKSAGNVVNPLDWMDAYGSDALRFTLARGANPGADVPVGEEWVRGSRNFCNKLWNATRFALHNGATVAGDVPPAEELSLADRWILSRLNETIATVDEAFENYEFAKACDALYSFAWNDFCDWYVELVKGPLAESGPAADAVRAVLGHVLDVVLRLLHPVTPFVTEQLWLELTSGDAAPADAERSIVIASWPTADSDRRDAGAEQAIAAVQRLVTEVRRFRSDQGLKDKQRVPARLTGLNATAIAAYETQIRSLTWLTADSADFAPTASLVSEDVRVELDLAGTIDVAAERRRLEKDRAAVEKERAQVQAKLGNAEFLAKAPDAVVAKIHERAAAADREWERLNSQLGALAT